MVHKTGEQGSIKMAERTVEEIESEGVRYMPFQQSCA